MLKTINCPIQLSPKRCIVGRKTKLPREMHQNVDPMMKEMKAHGLAHTIGLCSARSAAQGRQPMDANKIRLLPTLNTVMQQISAAKCSELWHEHKRMYQVICMILSSYSVLCLG